MRLLWITLLLLCACDDIAVTAACGDPCWPGGDNVSYTATGTTGHPEVVTLCKTGTVACDVDGKLTGECVGAVLPKRRELCDSYDHNCDGDPIADAFGTDTLCDYTGAPAYASQAQGACAGVHAWGRLTCLDSGIWECTGARHPDEYEYCDGRDGDCDGIPDQYEALGHIVVDDLQGSPQSFCYTGPQGTEFHGVCRPGAWQCSKFDGPYCDGEITPRVDLCGDELDNDCDGIADNSYPAENPDDVLLDLVVIIDTSCSMETFMAAAQTALRTIDPARFGTRHIIEVPDQPTGSAPYGFSEICHPGADRAPPTSCGYPEPWRSAVNALYAGAGGYEPVYDALYQVATGQLPLARTPTALQVIVLIADEHGQGSVTEQAVADAVRQADPPIMLIAFTDFDDDFNDIVDASTGGQLLRIRPDNIQDLLPEAITTPPCITATTTGL